MLTSRLFVLVWSVLRTNVAKFWFTFRNEIEPTFNPYSSWLDEVAENVNCLFPAGIVLGKTSPFNKIYDGPETI